jgi:hypothetical protein
MGEGAGRSGVLSELSDLCPEYSRKKPPTIEPVRSKNVSTTPCFRDREFFWKALKPMR